MYEFLKTGLVYVTKKIKIASTYIGGTESVKIQSMCNTLTKDVEATVSQILSLEALGCEIIRVAVPDEESAKAIEKMIDLNEDVKQIIIGDLMFFEDPEKYKSEFSLVGYGPEVDFPSTVKEIKECFEKFNFITEIHKLHPLVGVIVAKRV